MREYTWQLTDRIVTIGRCPLVMGIVNVTPDSFSDGGHHPTTEAAVAHALELVRQGADLLDIGGESTRPGSQSVAADEELRRVVPVVEALATRVSVPLSIDTSKAMVAREGLAAGAHIINDVTAMQGDPAMGEVVRNARAGVILMHMQGTPATMQLAPHYADVVAEIEQFFRSRLQAAIDLGIAAEQIVFDPGIGFGKTTAHNLEVLAHLDRFQALGRPVCLGVSRKGLIERAVGPRPMNRRVAGSIAIACHALSRNAVQLVRVHDVEETHDAVVLFATIEQLTD